MEQVKEEERRRQKTTGRCTGCSFLCAVCRIVCYTCIRRSCQCCFSPAPRARTEISILVLGLQGAGKTTLLSAVAGELTTHDEEPAPTMGFAFKTVNVQDHLTLNFQELGGSEQIRMYWDRYYACKHLVVYVVDSSCSEEVMRESGEALARCLSSPSLTGLPLLLVCSKQEVPSAISPAKIRERLGLGEVERERKVAVISTSNRGHQTARESVTKTILQLLDAQTELLQNI
ncbi:ADP-ribosylation factor-like protein 15 [Geodia barretti]|uniref:ADP-ribosylation factor-like protein 15 n=1 Tax=Geodia barretti TaxID=519541 RepID=A0AA35W3R5_GEOBA|nr:ADP-ribosylation factor-like protein 15 [Geodia barretti]